MESTAVVNISTDILIYYHKFSLCTLFPSKKFTKSLLVFSISLVSGKVLVHCFVGMSRSATCALAYLMISRKMSATEAIRTVRMHRDIHPNEGFLQQLADLDNELKRERLYY